MVGEGRVWQGTYMTRRGIRGKGGCVAEKTATAADGTHPTRMHSCFADEMYLLYFSPSASCVHGAAKCPVLVTAVEHGDSVRTAARGLGHREVRQIQENP